MERSCSFPRRLPGRTRCWTLVDSTCSKTSRGNQPRSAIWILGCQCEGVFSNSRCADPQLAGRSSGCGRGKWWFRSKWRYLILAWSVQHDSNDLWYCSERRLFFIAALTEMSGKEKQLATDPDCSNILERMAHSMDDFARRVFVDRLAGSWVRFASKLQTSQYILVMKY